MSQNLSTQILEPFGCQVELDLTAPLSPAVVAVLNRLLAEHGLLLFRDQHLSMDDQIKLGKRFGNVVSVNGRTVGEYISNVLEDGALGAAELCFHSDLSFSRYPYDAVMLHAVDVVDGASTTRFAHGALAYERLDPAFRERLHGLQALLVWPLDPARRNRDSEVPAFYPRAIQPLIWTQRQTGRTGVYSDPNATDRIVGLSEPESEDILRTVWDVLLDPQAIYEHAWRSGDLVFWDNMALLHARGDVSQVGNRTLQRVTIGEKGYSDIFPQVDVSTSIGRQEPRIERSKIDELG